MPHYTQPPEKMTPFAQLLVDYMWNKRPRNSPPLSYSQLAVRLGIPKQSISNWILRGSVPPLDTVMIVLAKLHIPLRDLYDAYSQSGLTVPAWDQAQLATMLAQEEEPDLPATPRSRQPAAVPIPSGTRPITATLATVAVTDYDTTDADPSAAAAAEPVPYTQPALAPDESDDWNTLVAQTVQVLRDEGASEAMITSVVAHIRSRQSGEATPIQRSLIAEHTEPTEKTSEANDPEANTTARTSKRSKNS